MKTLSPAAKAGFAVSAACATALAFAQAAFAVAPPSVQKALPVAPVKGEVTLGYGEKSKLLSGDRAAHEGIDIRAARGEPVRSAGAGKVIAATDRYQGKTAWGKVVAIDHGHGLVTRYAHLDKYSVRKGDQVGAGDIIGAVGATGVASGPHLHFEIISEGKTIDPAPIAAAAPAEKASTTMRRSVNVAATATAVAPLADLEKIDESRREKTERKLETKRMRLEKRMQNLFSEFDAFSELEGKSFQFDDFDLEEFEGAAQLFAELNSEEFLATLPDFTNFVEESRLSDEEIEAIRENREQALEAAAEAMERAREELDASREARREAMKQVRESARERKQAQREIEKAMREWEKHQSRNMQERERLDLRDFEMRDQAVRDKKEFEKALREAQKDLEQELAELERLRQKMTRSELSRD